MQESLLRESPLRESPLRAPLATWQVWTAIGLMSLPISGCASLMARPANLPDPAGAVSARLADSFADAPQPNGSVLAANDWWTGFKDPVLDDLVSRALSGSLSVQTAAARVVEARALGRATVAQYVPTLVATSSIETGWRISGDSAQPGAERFTSTLGAGPAVSWEIPLFGRLPNSIMGAQENIAAAQADLEGARAALVADVAAAYLGLRQAQAQDTILAQTAQVRDEVVRITDIRAKAGLSARADLADAQRASAQAKARRPDLALEIDTRIAQLALLTGMGPGKDRALEAQLRQSAALPQYQMPIGSAVPADLLRLRPDVRAAQARALVQFAGVNIAKADLYPQISFTGSLTASTNLAGNALPSDRLLMGLAPQISLPLWDFGRRKANIALNQARFEQTMLAYQTIALGAASEATQALSALQAADERIALATQARDAAATRAKAVAALYDAGISALRDRLEADQQLLDTNLTLASAHAAREQARVALFRAFALGPKEA